MLKKSNQEHNNENFIEDSGSMSHIVKSEENIINQKDAKTQVTVRDSRTLTGTKHVDWHGYQRRDGNTIA